MFDLRFSKGTGGQVGGSSRTDQIIGRADHHRASNYALLTVLTELQEPSERCSGYEPRFEGLRGAFENLERDQQPMVLIAVALVAHNIAQLLRVEAAASIRQSDVLVPGRLQFFHKKLAGAWVQTEWGSLVEAPPSGGGSWIGKRPCSNAGGRLAQLLQPVDRSATRSRSTSPGGGPTWQPRLATHRPPRHRRICGVPAQGVAGTPLKKIRVPPPPSP